MAFNDDNHLTRLIKAPTDGRIRSIWRGLVPWFVSQLVRLVGLVAVLAALRPAISGLQSFPAAVVMLLAVALVLLVATGIALVVSSRIDARPYAEYGFAFSARWFRDMVGGIAIGVLMVCCVATYLQIRGYATVSLDVSGGAGTTTVLSSVGITVVLLVYFLANVVSEEVVFRAILLRNFSEGASARVAARLPAVASAVLGSAVVFGIYHVVPPGNGGLATIITSAGMGVVFALAYVLTGEIALPLGIHFGGVFLFSMQQADVFGFGYTLPTVFVFDFTAQPTYAAYEIMIIRVIAGIALLVGWMALVHGDVSIDAAVCRLHDRRVSE